MAIKSDAVLTKLIKEIESGRVVILWKDKKRISEKHPVAWGYEVCKDDPLVLKPIPEQLILLFKAEHYLHTCTYAGTQKWLEEMTGRTMSESTFKNLTYKGKYHDYYKKKDIANRNKIKKTLIVKDSAPAPEERKRRDRQPLAQRLAGKTKEEKALILAQKEETTAKQRAAAAKRKVRKLKGLDKQEETKPSESREDGDTKDDGEAQGNSPADIIWKPNPGPQTDFLQSDVSELFFGGARGGSKSEALVADPLRYCSHGKFRGLLLRKRLKDLREIISRAKVLYPQAYPGTRFLKQESMFVFPSGATLEFGYAENDADVEQYQGQEYSWMGIDELPQFKDPEVYSLLRGSCRTTDPTLLSLGLPVMRMTGNPGNVGSPWVKRMFIDPAPAGKVFQVKSKFTDPRDGTKREVAITRQFIQSSVFDTPQLLQDESYLATLASLPEHKKQQWLYGNWDIIENAAFPEFDRDVHVIKPFEIPANWPKIRCSDWGYNSPFCTLWIAFDKNDTAYVYREYYGEGVLADAYAHRVCDLEMSDSNLVDAVIDGSTNSRRGEIGPSIFEMIETVLASRGHIGNRFADRSPGSREAGKLETHNRLALRGTGRKDHEGNPIMEPAMFIFDTCLNLIRTLPLLEPDDNNPEAVSKKNSEDHAYDALHYGLRSRPITALELVKQKEFVRNHQPMMVDPVFGY